MRLILLALVSIALSHNPRLPDPEAVAVLHARQPFVYTNCIPWIVAVGGGTMDLDAPNIPLVCTPTPSDTWNYGENLWDWI